MEFIEDLEALHALYDAPVSSAALSKVADRLTPLYRKWIEASRFCILTTVGPEGTDGTPRGDDGPVVRILDERTLALPDWRGNNRIDSLRNIVRDGRVSLLFMVPGSNNVIRVNGAAQLTADPAMTKDFVQMGKHPRSVIVITVGEVYFQCAKAIMRAGLWSTDRCDSDLPTAGEMVREGAPDFDADTYDLTYEDYAKGRMW